LIGNLLTSPTISNPEKDSVVFVSLLPLLKCTISAAEPGCVLILLQGIFQRDIFNVLQLFQKKLLPGVTCVPYSSTEGNLVRFWVNSFRSELASLEDCKSSISSSEHGLQDLVAAWEQRAVFVENQYTTDTFLQQLKQAFYCPSCLSPGK